MKNIVNTLLGKEHKNFMFGTKDHKETSNLRFFFVGFLNWFVCLLTVGWWNNRLVE